MKKLFNVVACIIFILNSNAQNVGIGTNNPDPSARLQIDSKNMGILIPKVNLNIATFPFPGPANSLLVWNIDPNFGDGIGYHYNSGTPAAPSWLKLAVTDSLHTKSEIKRFGNVVRNTTDLAIDDFVFGSLILNDTTGSDDDNRFFFDKSKAAFRAGGVSNSNWDTDTIGVYSTATGLGTIASGLVTVAMGRYSYATGDYSISLGDFNEAFAQNAVAIGRNSDAHGDYSTAIGSYNRALGLYSNALGAFCTASGEYSFTSGRNNYATGSHSTSMGNSTDATGKSSTAMGAGSRASGDYSTAISLNGTAPSFGETNIGIYSENYYPASDSSFVGSDRLFVIGNGMDFFTTSNALTILKNGNTGIGTSSPTEILDVIGNVKVSGNIEAAGNIEASNNIKASGDIEAVGDIKALSNVELTGFIKAPNWPAFNVYNNQGGHQSTIGKFNATVEVFDNGNNFDLATDEFTAPVNGFYQFNWTSYSGTSTGRVFLFVNGIPSIQTNTNDKSISVTLEINSGDKISLGGNGWTMHWYASVGHNAFSGHLIMAK